MLLCYVPHVSLLSFLCPFIFCPDLLSSLISFCFHNTTQPFSVLLHHILNQLIRLFKIEKKKLNKQFMDHMKPVDKSQLDYNLHSLADPANSCRNFANGCEINGNIGFVPDFSDASSLPRNGIRPVNEEEEEDNDVEGDYFDGVLKYINQILMEEDLEEKACMFHDCLALQAAQDNLYHVLNEVNPCDTPRSSSVGIRIFNDPKDDFNSIWMSQSRRLDVTDTTREEGSNGSGGEKTSRFREEDNQQTDDGRTKKLLANFRDETENTEDYDKALLCQDKDPNFYGESPSSIYRISSAVKEGGNGLHSPYYVQPNTCKRGRPKASDKICTIREVVDLRDYLPRCAFALTIFDFRTAEQLLKKIRNHSSPYGDATERLAYCFANALEARIAGVGSNLYASLTARRASCADILKAYLTYVTVCPFQRMSNIFANKSIARFTRSASRVHIIDFGILDGFQWPCIIHGLSLRPGGPPSLRITGIDFPQPGFRPAERVEQTGHRLAKYAKRFDIPFDYNAIAKKWDTISIDDVKIDRDEMLVVNCLYKLKNLNDEAVGESSPRDLVMKFIKNLNPDLFVHGVLNAGYNAPFFETRFREAMYHFSSMFDMFEATLPREDQERLMFEKEILGRDVMNVIACEGSERVDRPDTYKQWQLKNERLGFRQLPLDKKIMKEVKFKVKSCYHKDFLADEDCNWMLQGWKGRVLYALSCWTPNIM